MRSTMGPSLGHGYDEPARPAWTFRKPSVAQAEPTEADEPPEDVPVAVEPTVTPALRELGEAHFWPHARVAGDLSSPDAVKIVTRGDGVWVYGEGGRRYFDTLSGMWLNNIGYDRREVADAVSAHGAVLGDNAGCPQFAAHMHGSVAGLDLGPRSGRQLDAHVY